MTIFFNFDDSSSLVKKINEIIISVLLPYYIVVYDPSLGSYTPMGAGVYPLGSTSAAYFRKNQIN